MCFFPKFLPHNLDAHNYIGFLSMLLQFPFTKTTEPKLFQLNAERRLNEL